MCHLNLYFVARFIPFRFFKEILSHFFNISVQCSTVGGVIPSLKTVGRKKLTDKKEFARKFLLSIAILLLICYNRQNEVRQMLSLPPVYLEILTDKYKVPCAVTVQGFVVLHK